MKRKLLQSVVLLLCLSFGWFIGYLRLPYIDHTYTFWVGFLWCLLAILLIIAYRVLLNKNISIIHWITSEYPISDTKSAQRNYELLWFLVSILIVSGGSISGIMIWRQNKQLEAQGRITEKKINELSAMTHSIRTSNQVFLMSHVLDKVDEDIKNNPGGRLSDATIARVSALSFSFKPYRYFEGDSLSSSQLSPERGQLLVALVHLHLDTVSFAKIKASTTFAFADLRGVDMSGADLRGIDLSNADLSFANLKGINMSGSQLRSSRLEGAIVTNGKLNNCNFSEAYLGWAVFCYSEIISSTFCGANLELAQLEHVVLNSSNFDVANLSGTILKYSTLLNTDLARSNLTNADLSFVDLTGGRLIKANINASNLEFATLENVEVHFDWKDRLSEYGINGYTKILAKYRIAHISDSNLNSKYYLKKVN